MARAARMVVPGALHHITQRGNNRQDVFFVDDDRRAYLALLKESAARYGLRVVGYCLMVNHVHLVAIPSQEQSLARAVGRTHHAYAQYINRLHGRSGHLWQNRFYSCALEAAQGWAALRYVECNPVRAGVVRQAWRYAWSSARAHVDGGDQGGLLHLRRWAQAWNAQRWKQWLGGAESEEQMRTLRKHARSGRPLGSDRFLSKLEGALGRRVRALPVGRPRKQPSASQK